MFVNAFITFQEKTLHSRALFSGVNRYEQYRDAFLSFAEQISYGLRKRFDNENLFLRAKDVILNNLLFDIFPFRIWVLYHESISIALLYFLIV